MSSPSGEKYTSILNKYPSHRRDLLNGCWKYMQGRRIDDNAEGLWRVHEKLYDLNEFIGKHPGGEQWLILSKGTDVTEAFESHHITPKAAQVLAKFYVREASKPRNYKYTFDENGFYKTLKRRVADKLSSVNVEREALKSKLISDINLIALFVSSTLACRAENGGAHIFWTLIAGQCLAWVSNFSHNFIHQKDNWRMYCANLTFINWRDWRVFHTMSHHMYPNTFSDLEISVYEPHFKWIPYSFKSKLGLFYSYLVSPFVYMIIFHGAFIQRFTGTILSETKVWYWDELLSLTLPITMLIFGGTGVSTDTVTAVFYQWGLIVLIAAFLYALFAFSNGHHGPSIVHEGDEFSSLDFGVFQVRSIMERREMNESNFSILAYYGLHCLHHLFPTIDHCVLPHLKQTFIETCNEFEVNLSDASMLQTMSAQFRQLARTQVIKLE